MTTRTPEQKTGWKWMTLAYVVACVGAGITLSLIPETDILWKTFWADLVATGIIFGFSFRLNNSSLYDPYWSFVPIVMAGYWLIATHPVGNELRAVILLILVGAWGLRLTGNFYRVWPGLHHEDWRYRDFRESTGRWYWLVSLSGIHCLPTILVFLAMIPVYEAMASPTSFGVLDLVGVAVTVTAIAIETIADEQLVRFRKERTSPDEILATGLWRYSRHPNYFGECLFWTGLFIIALGANDRLWWTGIGLVLMYALFLLTSVPMTDQNTLRRRPEYAEHMKRVSGLFPWFPKKS